MGEGGSAWPRQFSKTNVGSLQWTARCSLRGLVPGPWFLVIRALLVEWSLGFGAWSLTADWELVLGWWFLVSGSSLLVPLQTANWSLDTRGSAASALAPEAPAGQRVRPQPPPSPPISNLQSEIQDALESSL